MQKDLFIGLGLLIIGMFSAFMLGLDMASSDKEASPTPCTVAVEFVNKEYASHLQEGVLVLPMERVKALNGLVASACVGGE